MVAGLTVCVAGFTEWHVVPESIKTGAARVFAIEGVGIGVNTCNAVRSVIAGQTVHVAAPTIYQWILCRTVEVVRVAYTCSCSAVIV